MRDGFVSFKGYRTYYKVYGDKSSKKLPLLVLHGGPGSTHHYLLNLAKLADSGRQVIFYDQFGTGQSDGREERQLWKVKTFTDQVDAVRKELDLHTMHLLGHSWGGMLAIEYLLTKPKGVRSAILASAMVNMPLYQTEVDKLVAKLPKKDRLLIDKHHRAGTVDNDEYLQAFNAFQSRHIFRGRQWPEAAKTPAGARNPQQYKHMWGLSEAYTQTGTLKDWDVLERLHQIAVPTLITAGRYDELTPHQAEMTQERIPNSRVVIFENSSHCHHIEAEKKFLETVTAFIDENEA